MTGSADLNTADFYDYDLPESSIAQEPLADRAAGNRPFIPTETALEKFWESERKRNILMQRAKEKISAAKSEQTSAEDKTSAEEKTSARDKADAEDETDAKDGARKDAPLQTSSDDSEGDAKKASVSDDEQPPQYDTLPKSSPDTMKSHRMTPATIAEALEVRRLHVMLQKFVIDAKTNGLLTLLFGALRNADSHIFAKLVEQFIWSIWTSHSNVKLLQFLAEGQAALLDCDYDKAVAAFTTVVNEDPLYVEVLNRRATAYFHLGNTEKCFAVSVP